MWLVLPEVAGAPDEVQVSTQTGFGRHLNVYEVMRCFSGSRLGCLSQEEEVSQMLL
jgi:hypothetical protein